MAEQFKNLASTQLDGGIDDSVTAITVDDAMGFTDGDFRILIDDEIMKITAVSGLVFTAARGQEGTAAASHSDNAPVYHVLTAGALDDHEQNDLNVRDTYASKPAAGTPGRIFLPTDGVFLERDNGTTWEKFGPIWPMTPPALADLPTWVNQGTSTAENSKGTFYLQAETASGENLRARVKTYPTPPFTVEMAFIHRCQFISTDSSTMAGLCIRDSSGGGLQTYGVSANYLMNSSGRNYDSATVRSSTYITDWPNNGTNTQITSTPFWVKYEDDTSNRKISFSCDGISWNEMVSLSVTDFITPDQIGVFVNGYNLATETEIQSAITVLHWKET